MRSMWNGTLHLAELAIPVGLAAGKGRSDVQLTTLHRACRNPLEQSKECPIHGAVAETELVKAWQVTPGEYVLIEDDELDAAGKVSDDHRLDVIAVIPRLDVEPTMVLKTLFVKPGGKGPATLAAYRLLGGALAELEAALLVRFHAWNGEHVAAISPFDDRGVLVAQTLVTADDVRNGDAIAAQLETVDVDQEQRELGRELLDRLLVPLTPELLTNQRRERLKALVEQKLTGAGTVRAEPVAETATAAAVVPADLADALKRSLKTTKKTRRRSSGRKPVAA